MKLYIKANHLKILKNLESLTDRYLSKSTLLVDKTSAFDYQANLKSTQTLLKHSKRLFYEETSLNRLIKGVYFGNTSCEHLLPTIHEIVQAREICETKHNNFVFAFPPISQANLSEAEYILNYLAQTPDQEVVVNDFSLLNMARKHTTLKPILGINFTKIIKNAFVDTVTQSDISPAQFANQQTLQKSLEFEVAEVRTFYKGLGVGRFAIENIDANLDFIDDAPRMVADFYYPHITISHSKACDIAGSFEDKRGYFAHDTCSRYCNFASLEFAHTETLGLRQRYNTIYKTHFALALPKALYRNAKNRLVWEIFV